MRVLAIRGQDLTSLVGSFEVDFEAEPLASAGIFAITGPTGAGKSTLLDAVCLALFNEVPRLASPGQGQVGAAGGEMLSISDTRALLRHRAPSGFAEVDFIGVDRTRYRARWSVRRARDRPDGALQNVMQHLTNLETGERLGGTRTETLEAIRARVGLSADEFGRAVMLAQGGFNAFIDANPASRAELLEKLTGTHIYTRLGIAARQKGEAIRQGLSAIEARIVAQGGLDDIARGEAEARLDEARTLHGVAQAGLAELEGARQWYATASTLAARVHATAQALEGARGRQTEAQLRRSALEIRKQAWSVVPLWQAVQDADAKAGQAAGLLEQLRSAADDARTQAGLAASRDQAAAALLVEAERGRGVQQPALETARALDRRLADLDGVLAPMQESAEAAASQARTADATYAEAVSARQLAADRQAAIASWLELHQADGRAAARHADLAADLAEHLLEAERAQTLAEEAAGIAERIEAARAADGEAEAAEAGARQELEAATTARDAAREALPPPGVLADLAADRDRLSAIEPCLVTFERFDAELGVIQRGIDGAEAEIAQLDAGIAARSTRAAAIVAELPVAIARHDEAVRAGALSEAASDEAAERMRAALVLGEPCPVCGGTDHAVEVLAGLLDGRAAEDQERIRSLAAGIAALEQEQAVLQDREVQHAARRAEIAGGLRELRSALTGAQGQWDQARSALLEALSQCAIAMDEDVPAVRPLVSGRVAALDARRQQLVTAQEQERVAQEAVEAGGRLLAGKAEARRAAASALQELGRRNTTLAAELAEAGRRRDHVAAGLDAGLLSTFDWRADPEPVATLDRIVSSWSEQDRALLEIEAGMPALVEAVHAADLDRQRMASGAQSAAQAVADRQSERAQQATERASILGGEAVEAVSRRLDDAVGSATEAREAARAVADAARAEASAAQARCEQAQLVLDRDRADAVARQLTLETGLAEKGIEEALVASVAAQGVEALQAEETALAALDEAVIVAATEHASRERDHAAYLETPAPALPEAELAGAIEAAASAEATARATMDDAQLVIRQDDRARAATAELRASLAEAQAAGKVWLQLDTLIGDTTGSRFRRFAQGLTLEHLLRHANARLAELKPRYLLERGQGGDMLIQVIDNELAGEVRGLANLSGGERFLVSLALALGLSEMSTGEGRLVESLFIDEGFGSLDSASLGQAIGALEQLHATGRRVGVISHIEDVKERIAVKIEVTPTAKGRSAIEVVGG